MFEFVYSPENGCDRSSLAAAFHGQRRVLVYVGFPDPPDGFDDLLLEELDDLGAVIAYGEFSQPSRAVVIDLEPAAGDSAVIRHRQKRPGQGGQLIGCVGAKPMTRW